MLLRSPACWTMPVTTSLTRSTYSSYIIARSASRIRCWMTCLAVCAAMRPKFSGVTSARLTWSAGDLGPVDVELLVEDQGVAALAVFDLGLLELGDRALARLLDQPRLDVGGQLDAPHAEVALVVELDLRMARRARGLLVGREQGVLERVDEGVLLDPLLALDLPDGFQNLSAHLVTLRRSDSRARWRRTAPRRAGRRRRQPLRRSPRPPRSRP